MSNLFTCPDCNKEVSKTAKVCPHCGNKKIQNQIANEAWKNMDPKIKIKSTIIAIVILMVIVGLIQLSIQVEKDPKRGCDCARILDVPTFKVTEYGMPLPIEDISNSDFDKYKSCYDEYAGVAGAILECGGR